MPAGKRAARKQDATADEVKRMGRYIVADPRICHGKPVFLGTRIMVDNVLELVAEGMPWDEIVHEWEGKVSREAIAEAVDLARQVFVHHAVDNEQRKAS
jgi:uncharacterized protein (DUF433 family)